MLQLVHRSEIRGVLDADKQLCKLLVDLEHPVLRRLEDVRVAASNFQIVHTSQDLVDWERGESIDRLVSGMRHLLGHETGRPPNGGWFIFLSFLKISISANCNIIGLGTQLGSCLSL